MSGFTCLDGLDMAVVFEVDQAQVDERGINLIRSYVEEENHHFEEVSASWPASLSLVLWPLPPASAPPAPRHAPCNPPDICSKHARHPVPATDKEILCIFPTWPIG